MLAPKCSKPIFRTLGWGSNRPQSSRASNDLKYTSRRPFCQSKSFSPITEASFRNPKVFASRKTGQLIFNYSILRSCSITPLVAFGTKMLDFLPKIKLEGPAHWVVGKTYFKHFVAGSTLQESINTAQKLHSAYGIGAILDYSIESADGNIDAVVDTLVDSIRLSSQDKKATPFSCFKVTGLSSPHLLLRMTELFDYQRTHPDFEIEISGLETSTNFPEYVKQLIEKKKKSPNAAKTGIIAPHASPAGSPPAQLTIEELEQHLLPLSHRLEKLGEAAHKYDLSVLIDAEQSWNQAAIHFASRCLSTRYNQTKPLFYNTYQMYLKESLSKLKQDMEYHQKRGLVFGAKLVRGAYMDAEAQWAQEHHSENPVFPNIEGTHQSYNSAVKLLLESVKNNNAAVVIASHNEKSLIAGSEEVARLQLSPNHPHIHFAQLYGMCDHISLSLAQNGHNVVKYVPFGPIHELLPYLLRRVAENKGFLSSTYQEQQLMWREIKSRLSL